jgi:uronate dehydrogenase
MTAPRFNRLLLTGAAGALGKVLRQSLKPLCATLRLSDIADLGAAGAQEELVQCDLADAGGMEHLLAGVDAVVHMGGISVEGPWPPILAANIIGAHNLYEAARRNGVKRILFATSNHAVGFYRRDQTIDHRVYPKPDSRYGVSKVFGEAVASLYADKYGVESLMMRIGNVNPRPVDKRRLSIWISPRDIAQLVTIGIEHPDIRFEIVYGVSGNKRSWYDNSNAHRLGYRPQDDSEPLAGEVLRNEKPGADAMSERYQGGMFVLAEIGGDPSKATPSTRKGARASAKKPARAKRKK